MLRSHLFPPCASPHPALTFGAAAAGTGTSKRSHKALLMGSLPQSLPWVLLCMGTKGSTAPGWWGWTRAPNALRQELSAGQWWDAQRHSTRHPEFSPMQHPMPLSHSNLPTWSHPFGRGDAAAGASPLIPKAQHSVNCCHSGHQTNWP